MALPSGSRRSESGAQLLARLSSRPDLKGVDSFIFGNLSPPNQIIELYGTEGTGKTELALQSIAKVCLPSIKHGLRLGGLEAKVIYIDTDCKFSILRLAVILERHVHRVINSGSTTESKDGNSPSLDVTHSNQGLEKCKHLIGTDKCQTNSYSGNKETFCEDVNSKSCTMKVQTDKSLKFHSGQNEGQDDIPKSEPCPFHSQKLTPDDIENIVHESLGRLQIFRVSNSQQLLASLLTLESFLLDDFSYSLLVIDSISTFFWVDRIASPTSYHHLDARMIPIAKALKRYSSDFGVTCLITKSAYFQGKKSAHVVPGGSSNSNTSNHSSDYDVMYNEYLGKIWSSCQVRRIILTNVLRGENRCNENSEVLERKTMKMAKTIHAFCMSSQTDRYYSFRDDLLLPD